MIFWFTGQPGHGKTLHAIDKALDYVEQGRLVYVCNVTDFDHGKAGCLPMTPEQFRDWPNFLPDGAVALVDEAYEHDMLPKRPPGSKVPDHVKALAKHRHRGLDFIFVAQSPAKQVDEFVHDLIERHVHVRRRFGLMFAHLRIFDRYEKNPEKAHPLILQRVKLPKRPMGLYKSTALDTTERKVPWYYPAAAGLLLAVVVGGVVVANNVRESFTGERDQPVATADGAVATAAGATNGRASEPEPIDALAWLQRQIPRVPGMPWSAPLFDERPVVSEPEVFCMASSPGIDALGQHHDQVSCRCLTEQGTTYEMPARDCNVIARRGSAYNPYKSPERESQGKGRAAEHREAIAAPAPSSVPAVGFGDPAQGTASYGGFRP